MHYFTTVPPLSIYALICFLLHWQIERRRIPWLRDQKHFVWLTSSNCSKKRTSSSPFYFLFVCFVFCEPSYRTWPASSCDFSLVCSLFCLFIFLLSPSLCLCQNLPCSPLTFSHCSELGIDHGFTELHVLASPEGLRYINAYFMKRHSGIVLHICCLSHSRHRFPHWLRWNKGKHCLLKSLLNVWGVLIVLNRSADNLIFTALFLKVSQIGKRKKKKKQQLDSQ